jgi:hypothetical protein
MCRELPRASGRSCARVLCIAIPDDRGDESFADDLNMGRGIVSGRVALLLRSTEIRPPVPMICPSFENPLGILKRESGETPKYMEPVRMEGVAMKGVPTFSKGVGS